MATITADEYLDSGTARTTGESWTLNGGKLTIRTDTRWHADAPASMTGTLGSQTISSTLGGGVLLDGRDVRWIPITGGSGTPAWGDTVGQGANVGYYLGFWSSLTAAPALAIGATGFIKIRSLPTPGGLTAGALTFSGAGAATAGGPDVAGWIEVVANRLATITVPRLGTGHQVRGDWFYLDDTTGVAGQVLQVPTNNGGADTHCPGVWVETGVASDVFEFWPALWGASGNSWLYYNFAGEGDTDVRQQFVKSNGSGEMVLGESVTAAVTFASAPAGAATYTWLNDVVNVSLSTHGYSVGDQVYLDFTSGGGTPDGVYTIESVPTTSIFTVALAGAGTAGNVSVYGRTTVTLVSHNLPIGNRIYVDATSGTLTDGIYEVMTVPGSSTFTINTPEITLAGNATLRFTLGHLPVSGLRTRIPNVILRTAASGVGATNYRETTPASRPEFLTSSAGAIDHEYAYGDWYYNLLQPYSVKLHHTASMDQMNISECATGLDLLDGGLGMMSGADVVSMALLSCFAGGTIEDWTVFRGNTPGSSDHAVTVITCIGQEFINCKFGVVGGTRSSGLGYSLVNSSQLTFTSCKSINGGQVSMTTCSDVTFNDFDWTARLTGSLNTGSGYAFVILSKSADILINGVTFGLNGTIDRQYPYNGIFNVTASDRIKMRNVGTYAAPIGGTLKLNDLGYVYVSGGNNFDIAVQRVFVDTVRTSLISDVNTDKNVLYESLHAKHLSTRLPLTLTVAALNAQVRGCTAPTQSLAANASVYGTHWMDLFTYWVRQSSTYTWASDIVTVSFTGHGLAVGDKVFLDFTSGGGTPDGVYTVKTVTSTSVYTVALAGSGASGNVMAYRANTTAAADAFVGQGRLYLPLNENTFETDPNVTVTGTAQFTSAPGLSLPAASDEAVIEMQHVALGHTAFPNIPPTVTGAPVSQASTYTWAANVLTVTFTAHGLKVGDQVYLDATSGGLTPDGVYTIAGITSANVYTISLTGSGAAGNVTVYRLLRFRYKIDIGGAGYNVSWRNLLYYRPSGSTTSGSAVITMVDTTGVAVDDYIYGIGVGVDARVLSVDSGTQITATVNSVATGSNLLLSFNRLPGETIVAADGFRLQVSIDATTPGSKMAVTYLQIPTVTTDASRAAAVYPLDTVPITITVKDVNTGLPVEDARVHLVAASGGPAPVDTVILSGITNVAGVVTGTTEYTAQPVVGRSRRATIGYGTLYKSAVISDTVSAAGLEATVLMIPDE